MEPLPILLIRSTYDLLPNTTNLKLWGYTGSDLCFCCKSDRVSLRHVLSAYPQSLQKNTWCHNKVLEVVKSTTWDSKPATCYKEPIIQFPKEGECPMRKQEKTYKHTECSSWLENFSGSQDISIISCSHYSNRKVASYFSVVRFKEECHPHRIDCLLGREPGEVEEKTIRETACRLHGKGLKCHVIPIEVGCHRLLGHTVILFH